LLQCYVPVKTIRGAHYSTDDKIFKVSIKLQLPRLLLRAQLSDSHRYPIIMAAALVRD
jgi:hypothetical protein